ncbi:MAG: DUF1624 domain-containing protein [Acidobacteria bacterium]|nr:DUF1624 domain-containing protein [Acidobacteriota bacterium]
MRRRLYIDWLRGVAVLCMILWHVADAWTVRDGRDGVAFAAVAFLAGWAAPLFLFLAGLSVPLAARARMARGLDRSGASRMLQRRGWQIFGLAHLFRVQSFLLNANGSWNAILKPDILNILGLGLVLTAIVWRQSLGARGIVIWMIVPAVAIVGLMAPWAETWWWPSLLHPRLEAYVRPVGNYGVFSLFPPLAYVLAGAAIGEWLSLAGEAVLRPIGVAAALMLAGGVGLTLWLRPAPDRWFFDAIAFLWRTGAMALMLVVARAVVAWAPGQGHGLLVLFGQTSLFVYWVHVELAYGIFSYPLHHTLGLGAALIGYAAVVWSMAGLAGVWARRPAGARWIPAHMAAPV